MRASGILLPIFSLPSKYGIGCFSNEAYDFVDFLEKSGQKYWQILPLGPTGYGDSPYQSFSTFAGNPYFIDLDTLKEEGLLTQDECSAYENGWEERAVNYERIYFTRFKILKKAFKRSYIEDNQEFQDFIDKNTEWLADYSLFMAIKNHFQGISWLEWDEDIRIRQRDALKRYSQELREDILFFQFQQFKFWEQWTRLKSYANKKGIKIIGDIPIYVALDSVDSWADYELFQFDENRKPVAAAGCPPDAFSETGQLWGNPLYDWEYHKKTSYKWWVRRMKHCFELYDTVRVDHFRGFDEYYSIPAGDKTAESGRWMKGPGYQIFEELNSQAGQMDIIAEDLGHLTESVTELVKKTGYPGMKVLEFAFDSGDSSAYLPHHYGFNCIVYTGTHDNQTIKTWFAQLQGRARSYAMDYVNLYHIPEEERYWEFIRLALASTAKLAVIPIQDYLGLGEEARINYPSTLGGNWEWRLLKEEVSDELADRIHKMVRIYSR
jgi:4-alpha-glucanotransferase